MPGDQQRTSLTTTQGIQMNQIQTPIHQIDIKTEHQTQQKQTIQVVRPQNVNQPFIAQSLPPNNVSVNANMNNTNVNVNVNVNVNANANIEQMAPGAVDDTNAATGAQSTSYNQKLNERMRQDESKCHEIEIINSKTVPTIDGHILLLLVLDGLATISAVLYANTNHPELKVDFPNWNDRSKQILKKWRALSHDRKAPYLQKSRENRSYLKKAQQVSDLSIMTNKPMLRCMRRMYTKYENVPRVYGFQCNPSVNLNERNVVMNKRFQRNGNHELGLLSMPISIYETIYCLFFFIYISI